MQPYDNIVNRFKEITEGQNESGIETKIVSVQEICEDSQISRVNLQNLSLSKEELELAISTSIDESLPKIISVLDTLLATHTLLIDPRYDILSAAKVILESLNTSISNLKLNSNVLNACGGNSLNDEIDTQISLMQNTKAEIENLVREGITEEQIRKVRDLFRDKYNEVYTSQLEILKKVLKELAYGDMVLSNF